MTPRLTDEDKQYIHRRYLEGASLRQIGRETGRPDITIRRTLVSLGVEFGPPKTTNQRTSPETETLVLRLYDQGLTWREIMEQAQVSDRTVARILERNGHEFTRKPESTASNTQLILELYEAGHSTRAIASLLGCSKSTVNASVSNNGGSLRRALGCGNPEFFDVVDTPESAYWLGFISADGCMISTSRHPEGNHLSFKLGIGDRAHLDKLHDTLQAMGAVRTGTQESFGKTHGYATLDVHSRRLAESLVRLGILPRKSETVTPWNGPSFLMPHFWRGLFDGDGSLARKGPGLWTVFLTGSEPCVRGFREWAHELCGTEATPYFRTGCWYVSISGRHQVRKLVHALYGDAAVSLDRKQEIADRILGTE